MVRITQLKIKPIKNESEKDLISRVRNTAIKHLKINEKNIISFEINKKSIDARKKDNVFYVFSIDAVLDNEDKVLNNKNIKNIYRVDETLYNPSLIEDDLQISEKDRPVVAGFGPAGIFAAYLLAINGLRPIVLERGMDVDNRLKKVSDFWNGLKIDLNTNVQFGEGGAGTFSDGKLNTQIKDPSGRIKFVLNTFIKYGADERIAYEQKPHIGTDVLSKVVKAIREDIVKLGGTINFESKITDIKKLPEDYVRVFYTNSDDRIISIDTKCLILAIGHSARDTFEMLRNKGINMSPKDFAVGYRVIHPQSRIDLSQYGSKYMDYFEAAPYKLAAKAESGKGVYSFCMCPGGFVVNSSSEDNELCINGMSYSGRDSGYANSAIVMTVTKDDYIAEIAKSSEDYDENDPLVGMHFQRIIEKKAYNAGSGKIPVQLYCDYVENKPSDFSKDLSGCIKGEYIPGSVRGIIPNSLEDAFVEGMNQFARKIEGFNDDDTIIAAVEGRTSSPVRIHRDDLFVSSMRGLYPCGEGAGYAGGITSAAVDGLKVAEAVINEYQR